MGASLLDQVLAETLDPAYRQAAEAREARVRAAEAAGEERPSPTTGRRLRAQVLVALVLALAGLLAAVTYDQVSSGAKGRAQVREALLGDIDSASATTDELARQLDTLRARVDRTRDSALRASAIGQVALGRLATAEQAAAAVPVHGPGLEVTLADAKPTTGSDPVGGSAQADTAGNVRDTDVQLVVNALWAAGAEAISINGQRLGPTSTVRTAGEAILVDFQPVSSPYVLSAVGDPETLSKKFIEDEDVVALADVATSYDMTFVFAKEDSLSLPAAPPAELHSATPVPAPSPGAEPSRGG
jgi:uncharacterized protein YlxW (UPF0749 family)